MAAGIIKNKGYKEKLLERLQINETLLTSVQGKVELYTLNARLVKLQALDAAEEGSPICRESNTNSSVMQPVF